VRLTQLKTSDLPHSSLCTFYGSRRLPTFFPQHSIDPCIESQSLLRVRAARFRCERSISAIWSCQRWRGRGRGADDFFGAIPFSATSPSLQARRAISTTSLKRLLRTARAGLCGLPFRVTLPRPGIAHGPAPAQLGRASALSRSETNPARLVLASSRLSTENVLSFFHWGEGQTAFQWTYRCSSEPRRGSSRHGPKISPVW